MKSETPIPSKKDFVPPSKELPEPINVTDEVAGMLKRFEKMRDESAAFAIQWRAWFASRDRPKVNCPEHVDVLMVINEEKSMAESFGLKENIIRLFDCPACIEKIRLAESSAVLDRAGVPEDMLHCTLDNWTPRTPEDRETLALVREYAADPKGALVLIGKEFGTGKSHLAVAVMRVQARRQHAMRFITQTAFVKKLRDTYDDKRAPDVVVQCINTPFLTFDELGLSSGGRDEQPAIHQVLDERKGDNRPFILTSNAPSPAALEEILGGRMMDRLREFTHTLRVLTGKSMRKSRF